MGGLTHRYDGENAAVHTELVSYSTTPANLAPLTPHCADTARDSHRHDDDQSTSTVQRTIKELIKLLLHDTTIHSLRKSVRFTFDNSKRYAALRKKWRPSLHQCHFHRAEERVRTYVLLLWPAGSKSHRPLPGHAPDR